MKRVVMCLACLVSVGALTVACEDKKDSTPILTSSTASAAAAPPSAPSASAMASAAPSSSKPDSEEPDDAEEETATSDISADNFEKELDGLEKEVSGKY